MPDKDGKLTKEEVEKTIAKLRSFGESPPCPISGTTTWQVVDRLGQINIYMGGKAFVGGPVYPCVLLVCPVCGYTMYLSAAQLGLVTMTDAPGDAVAGKGEKNG